MKLKQQRLRNDLASGVMQLDTLKLILDEHKRSPWQKLYVFDYRAGPGDRVSIYDLDLPRRKAITEDYRVGYEEADWWHNAFVANAPNDYIPRVRQVSRRTGDILRAGYIDILQKLLAIGSVVPSSCLDAWLAADTRVLCAKDLRLMYIRN